jgi:hypothetical protein
MQLSRRTFLASLAGALVAPRLALPAPPADMRETVADELIVFREETDDSIVFCKFRVVLYGATARAALERSPHLWSAVMVERRLV